MTHIGTNGTWGELITFKKTNTGVYDTGIDRNDVWAHKAWSADVVGAVAFRTADAGLAHIGTDETPGGGADVAPRKANASEAHIGTGTRNGLTRRTADVYLAHMISTTLIAIGTLLTLAKYAR